MQRLVLDAWAILALLQQEEPAASRVESLLRDAQRRNVNLFISIINLGEVYYRVGRRKGADEAQETLAVIQRLPLVTVPASDDLVFAAARLKMRYTVSYADTFAAATAVKLEAVLVSGDPEFKQLESEIPLEMLTRTSTGR